MSGELAVTPAQEPKSIIMLDEAHAVSEEDIP